jgi:23S rRNA-/tRNA-specific pseudouridylate synthase
VECYEAATLLTVRPKTGRTHQIRVHLAARGWPIVADPVYGAMSARSEAAFRARWGRVALALQEMPRQALHAQRIRFLHPVSGQTIELEAPLPPDLRSVIERLRAAAGK